MTDLKLIAEAGLAANNAVEKRIAKAGKTGQYKAVGRALARAVAKKAGCSEHQATWAVVNAFNTLNAEEDEEINDF